jgi:VWFA-related protein
VGKVPLILCCCAAALSQENSSPENVQDSQVPTFQSKVDLVLVPVVVRDKQGHPIGHLTKDDFQLLDRNQPQTIATFQAIERARAKPVARPADSPGASPPALADNPDNRGTSGSNRYFIYLFDDLDIRFADMAQMREAAVSHFKTYFSSGHRAAIATLSGRHSLEFTNDRDKLADAVAKLRWGTVAGHGAGMQCPDVSYYIARLVIMGDAEALEGLTSHTAECAHVRPELARKIAWDAANREIIIGSQGTQLALSALRRAIRRLAVMPGQRVLVLASPGFFAQTPEAIKSTAEVLKLAATNGVVIHGLSARGVIQADEEEDVAARPVVIGRRAPPRASAPDQVWIRYRRESANADGDVMQDLAEGTGGTFFHGNNDLRAGFGRLAAAPEFSYVLGFSPAELQPDGSFHRLKIRLPNLKGPAVEARRGYYALKTDPQASELAAQIEGAVFSRTERNDIPVVLLTGYSKPRDADVVKVQLSAKIDTSGRTSDLLDAVVALFDSEGGFVTQTAETVKPGGAGETVTLHWELPGISPGNYVVRLVILDPRSKSMTMMNRVLKVF